MSNKLIDSIPKELHIGGEWRSSSDGKRIPVVDSASGKVIAEVASGSASDASSAVDAAFQAGPKKYVAVNWLLNQIAV